LKRIFIVIALCAVSLSGAGLFAEDASKTEDIIKDILNDSSGGKPSAAKKAADRKNEAAEVMNSSGSKPAFRDASGSRKGLSSGQEAAPQVSSEEQVLLKTGIDFYNSGMYDFALKNFRELVARFPQSTLKDISNMWMGRVYLKQYKYDDAIKEFSMIPPDSGEYPAAVFYRGEGFMLKGETASAIESFEKVYMQFPQHELADKAVLAAGRLYLNQQKGEQALAAAVRIIKYYKDRSTIDAAYYLIGKVYEKDPRLKDIETARRVYKQFIKKCETDERFGKSPLKKRVEQDLARIERNYFKMER
jgi:TolA-binding protein